jgi:DNA-binding transcriptional ArsR family regulator
MTTLDITEVRGSTRRELLTFIRNNAGATSETIAAALGKPANQYTGTLRAMYEDNLISRQRDGRSFRYFIPDRVTNTEMEAEIDALEAWKADAIKRYPDLGPVDPLLVKAREIAVTGGWVDAFADEIIVGHLDSHPIVQAIYATLQDA